MIYSKPISIALALVSLASCGSYPESETPDKTNEPRQRSDTGTIYPGGHLPLCTAANQGQLFYVQVERVFKTCGLFGWEYIDLGRSTGPLYQDGPTVYDNGRQQPETEAQ